MGNHFHILLEVPAKRYSKNVDESEILAGVQALYGKQRRRELEQQLDNAREMKDESWREELLGVHRERRNDLAVFMKLLKQRFSIWYNRHHKRSGTLWEERYKSALVESSANALRAVASYIEFNPVRAGLVEDPAYWRWSGYGAASGGGSVERRGICKMLAYGEQGDDWRRAAKKYRGILFGSVAQEAGVGGKLQGVVDQEGVREVLETGGRLPLATLVRLRVRHFTDGVAIGSKSFVENVFESNRSRFGSRRKSGARRIRALEGPSSRQVMCMRDFRKNAYG